MDTTHKRAFTEKEAANYISMSRSFLRHGRMTGKREGHIPPPHFIKAGKRKIIYLKEDLDRWLEQFCRVEHLAQLQEINGGLRSSCGGFPPCIRWPK